MDYELIKMALMAINMLMTLALWLFALNERKQHATAQSIRDLEQHVAEKFEKVARLEADFQGIPKRDELIRIHQRIDEVIESSRQSNLLLGQVLGQLKQFNEGRL